jgi:hypothetical protein
LNLGAYFPIVHCNKPTENLLYFKLLLDHYTEQHNMNDTVQTIPVYKPTTWGQNATPNIFGRFPIGTAHSHVPSQYNFCCNQYPQLPFTSELFYIFLCQVTYMYITFLMCEPPNAIPVSHEFLSCRLGIVPVHDSCCIY